ncbi:hypothetical protein D4L85_21690 [Chryseolinea soli]|uniref:Uncharacterized protein n=1 Tax=Chryseolinea soli TaxID=2321403 RepID=A0A385SW47_9BACT|nr:hypothetical protein D4L85_21690 [Chryseolinea soli]
MKSATLNLSDGRKCISAGRSNLLEARKDRGFSFSVEELLHKQYKQNPEAFGDVFAAFRHVVLTIFDSGKASSKNQHRAGHEPSGG